MVMFNLDKILGMDFLATHLAIIDCVNKEVSFRIPGRTSLNICGDRIALPKRIISSLKASSLLRKGCLGFLAYVVESDVDKKINDSIPVVRDFLDVFSEELPGVVPDMEV